MCRGERKGVKRVMINKYIKKQAQILDKKKKPTNIEAASGVNDSQEKCKQKDNAIRYIPGQQATNRPD
jgi:hypothetical protein